MNLRSCRLVSSSRPSTSRLRVWNSALVDSLSRIRITASSPCTVGMIEIRKSMVRPENLTLKRPSCGILFSAMSSSDITLTRLTMVEWCRLSIDFIAWYKTPSMRYFTTTSRS